MTDDGIPEMPDDEKLEMAFEFSKRDARRITELEDAFERELDELRAENEELREEYNALRQRLPERSDKHPGELDFEEQVPVLREQAYRRAAGTGGRAALDYKEIRWGIFDDTIGDTTAYRLMRRAAGLDDDGNRIEDVPGFNVRKVGGTLSLAVDAKKAASAVKQAGSARNAQRGDV